MKYRLLKPTLTGEGSINTLWFMKRENKYYCFLWEFEFHNIWWKPKYIKEKNCWHIGWLFFQFGLGWNESN